jgi:hypothetical protein
MGDPPSTKLNRAKGRLRVEDAYAGARFVELVGATTRIAGPMITEAWNRDPAPADKDVHNPGWDFSSLDAYDDAGRSGSPPLVSP